MISGATALLRRRLPTRTCLFRRSPQHCGDRVDFQENGPMCAASSSYQVLGLSGIFACTARSKFLMKFLEPNLLTRVTTMKNGFISCTSTYGWLIAHLDNIRGEPSEKETVRSTTSRIAWPSTQENHVATRVRNVTSHERRTMPDAHQGVRRVNLLKVASCFADHVWAFVARFPPTSWCCFGHVPASTHRTHVT